MENRSCTNEQIAMELERIRRHVSEPEAPEQGRTCTEKPLRESEKVNMLNRNEMVSYHYIFTFSDGVKKEIEIQLDPVTLNCTPAGRQATPEWAKLEYSKCEICPLDSSQVEFCPIAAGLAELFDSFKDMISYEEVDVMLITDDRNIWKHTSMQEGISSLLCTYMVASGCPIMGKLKPMVRYHSPFASLEKTTCYTTSMYLLGQYFLMKKGLEPDWELSGLIEIYENIKVVNNGIYKRLRNASNGDAIVNAIAHLDIFACTLPYLIENSLNEIEYLFAAY